MGVAFQPLSLPEFPYRVLDPAPPLAPQATSASLRPSCERRAESPADEGRWSRPVPWPPHVTLLSSRKDLTGRLPAVAVIALSEERELARSRGLREQVRGQPRVSQPVAQRKRCRALRTSNLARDHAAIAPAYLHPDMSPRPSQPLLTRGRPPPGVARVRTGHWSQQQPTEPTACQRADAATSRRHSTVTRGNRESQLAFTTCRGPGRGFAGRPSGRTLTAHLR